MIVFLVISMLWFGCWEKNALASPESLLAENYVTVSGGGISIIPPAGWSVFSNYRGRTLVFEESPNESIPHSSPFKRTISLAVSHEARPMDEFTVAKLRRELTTAFVGYGKDFRLGNEYEFFDYRGLSRGIVIYSFLTVNSLEVTQLHVFVSGSRQSVLMTYSDLSQRFEQNKEAFTAAWNSLMSLKIEGKAPNRFSIFLGYLGFGLLLALVLGAISMRRKAMAKKLYDQAEDILFFGDESDELGHEDFKSMAPHTYLSSIPAAIFK